MLGLAMWLAFLTPPAPPNAMGPNASDAATVALSAPPADLTLEVPSAMASAAPTTSSAHPHLCVSTPGGLTPFASVPAFTTVPGLCSHSAHSAAHILSARYTLALSPSHIAIISPRFGSATSRIAAAAAGVIAIAMTAIIGVATVATNAKVPCSDDATHDAILRPAHATCLHKSPRSQFCLNRAASSSQLASSKPHMHMASAPSSGTMWEPRNSPTLPRSAAEKVTAQHHRLRMEVVVTVG